MPEIPGTMLDPKNRPRISTPRAGAGPTRPSSAKSSSKERDKKYKPPAAGWVRWWPVAVGVALACFASQLRDLLANYDPWGMRVVFPFVLLSGLREIGMSDELRRTLPQVILFIQLPLEGLLTKSNLGRGVKLSGAIAQLVSLHAVCVLVLWLVAVGAGK